MRTRALLVEPEDGVLVSYGLVSEQIGVTLEGRPPGIDVPLAVGSRDVVSGDGAPLPNDRTRSAWLKDGCPGGTEPGTCPSPGLPARPRQGNGSSGVARSYVTLGVVKGVAKDRAAIGLYTMFPVSSFVTVPSSSRRP